MILIFTAELIRMKQQGGTMRLPSPGNPLTADVAKPELCNKAARCGHEGLLPGGPFRSEGAHLPHVPPRCLAWCRLSGD